MRWITKDNIKRYVWLFIIIGGMLPRSVSATKPTHCVSVEDITDQENTELSYTFTYPPLTCYSFQVGANNPDTLKVTLKYANHGGPIGSSGDTVDLDMFLYDSSGNNVSILNSDQALNQGTNESFELKESDTPALTPNATYYVWINGVPDMDGYDFTLQWFDLDDGSNVTTWKVTPVAGANGTLSPSDPQLVEEGSRASFTVTPNYGYKIESVTGCGGSLEGATYTTGVVTEDCTVTATFTPIILTVTPALTTIGYGHFGHVHGSIDPSLPQEVEHGNNVNFTVSADAGYEIHAVTGCNGNLEGSIYTTGPIVQNCRVLVSLDIVDTDNDGIADDWEMEYFGNLTSASAYGDFDNDGYTDRREYLHEHNGVTDPDGSSYDPTVANAPGGGGYRNSFIAPINFLMTRKTP